MVGMQMGDKKIRLFQIDPQFFQPRLQDLFAGGAIHTRIDDQVTIIRGEDIRIDLFEGVPRQGNDNSVQPGNISSIIKQLLYKVAEKGPSTSLPSSFSHCGVLLCTLIPQDFGRLVSGPF